MPNFNAILLLGWCAATTCAATTCAARADVIATYRTVEGNRPVTRQPETLTLACEDALWTQSWLGSYGPEGASFRPTITLVQYEQERVVTMRPDLKIYKIEPLQLELFAGAAIAGVRLTRLEDEKVLGYATHHFFVDLIFEKAPFVTGGPLQRMEVWLLPASSNAQLPNHARNLPGLQASIVTGDTQFLAEVQSGIWIKQTVFDAAELDQTPGKPVYTDEVSALSIGALPASTFDIPGDYRQLSPAQYAAVTGKEALERRQRHIEAAERQADAT